jgi:hypothetical protein
MRKIKYNDKDKDFYRILPFVSTGITILGVLILGGYQLIKFAQYSFADLPNYVPFDEQGAHNWCDSSLKEVVNGDSYAYSLGNLYDQLDIGNDCGSKLSLVSASTWDQIKSIYKQALGGEDFLPEGIDAAWTTTANSGQVYYINSAGEIELTAPDTVVGISALPTFILTEDKTCVAGGSGTDADPYVFADESECLAQASPTPTPTPTPTTPSSPPPALTCNIDHCSACSSNNICSSCNTNYHLSNNQCKMDCLIDHCSACSSPNTCTSCNSGYYLENNQCLLHSTPTPTPTPLITLIATTQTPTPTPIVTPFYSPASSPSVAANDVTVKQRASVWDLLNRFEDFFTSVYPPFALLLFLLGLWALFFPRPQGIVLVSDNKSPIAKALVMILREGKFVRARLTNSHGLYKGFKLPPGEYQLLLSAEGYHFPSTSRVPQFYHYTTFRVRQNSDVAWAKNILLDRLNESSVPVAQPSKLLPLLPVFNLLTNFWIIGLVLAILAALIFTSIPNLIVLAAYIGGIIRRIISDQQSFNVTGRLLSLETQPLANVSLKVALASSREPAGQTLTDVYGNFVLYLKPDEKYVLSVPGSLFVLQDGKKLETISLDLKTSVSLDFKLESIS